MNSQTYHKYYPDCSVIVPTYNEEDNIKPLLRRISKAFSNSPYSYEIVIIDDNSVDDTVKEVKKFVDKFPIEFHKKRGEKGKAFSLIEGFMYSKGRNIAIIDADLQYPPEKIPEMVNDLENGSDVVVANRLERKEGFLRNVMSTTFRTIFGKWMHGLDMDIQSGLKACKRNVWERIRISPSPWTFDLPFLLQARSYSYKITSTNIHFAKRVAGKSKVKTVQTTFEIMLSAIKEKFNHQTSPPRQSRIEGFQYKGKDYQQHTQLPFNESAFIPVTLLQKTTILFFVLVFGLLLFINPILSITILFAIFVLTYFSALLFNTFVLLRGFSGSPEIRLDKDDMSFNREEQLPEYTILCPLYKEWNILPQFVSAISKLDYPKEKLQVLLLLEENDMKTRQAAYDFGLPEYFQVLIVPRSEPQTKPKACNYGLKHARGKYAVIYDAEDFPESDQLKKVVTAFQRAHESVVCVQAKLNYYNSEQNTLTKLFTGEYSLWFDLVLTGLQSIDGPIPLGGTSNHFRTDKLRELNGWDAFNVTEDCDLGVRLYKKGYRTAIINSSTWEEANSSIPNWIKQRSRWVKGYIQTYFVHLRSPLSVFQNGLKGGMAFHLVVGGKIFSLLINPVMWATSIAYFLFRPTLGPNIEAVFPPYVFYLGVFCMIVGNFLYFYAYMLGLLARKRYGLIKFGLLVPFYWLLMSLSAWVAVVQFVFKPHYWFKTQHGLHLSEQERRAQKPVFAYS